VKRLGIVAFAVAFAFALAVGGCLPWDETAGRAPPLTCPGRGGPRWIEVATPRFLLRSDVAPDHARALAAEAERRYALFESVFAVEFRGRPPPGERVRVILFGRADDVHALRPLSAGFYRRNGNAWEPAPTLTLHGGDDADTRRLLAHELAHHFLRQALPTAPAWLAEGLAEYYSSARPTPDGRAAVLGEGWDDFTWKEYQPTVRELFAADEARFSGRRGYYQQAWALVHLLASERYPYRVRFEAYLRALADGEAAAAAWAAAFAGVDLDALENAANRYRFVMRFDVRRVPIVAPAAVSAAPRALRDADVHLLWAELRSWRTPALRAQAALDLDAAQTAAPDEPEVSYWRACLLAAEGRRGEALAAMQAAVARAPDEPRYLFAVATAMLGGELPLDAVVMARLATRAETAAQLQLVSWWARSAGRWDDALAAARRAAEIDRASSAAWDALGAVLFGMGRVGEAIEAGERAVRLAPGSREYQQRLALYRGRR
jgi:tetratricopeptide (TPR) repeat protein